jgi:hypothetical protein
MAPDQEPTDRDAAVRTMLVERVTRPKEAPAMRLAPGRMRSGLVTAVVLVVIIAVSVLAVRFGSGRSAPADGGAPTTSASAEAEHPMPKLTVPAGKLLGRYSSADGPNQTHTIHPNGLAIATAYVCQGKGDYFFGVAHDGDSSGTPSCDGGGGGSGDKGIPGDSTVKIRTAKDMTWEFVVVGIPETYVTPQPVVSPTDSSGKAVPFCTAADLTAKYEAVALPSEVTEAAGGQVVFTNTSSATCALAGHPAMWFADQGATLGNAALERTDERSSEEKGLKPVIVPAGGKAYSQLDYYLPNYYPANDVAPCAVLKVHSIHIDIANRLAGAAQQGTFDVETPTITGCTNSAWGIYGKYGQLATTIFVDYSYDSKG